MIEKVNHELYFCTICQSYIWSEDCEENGHWIYDGGRWFCGGGDEMDYEVRNSGR